MCRSISEKSIGGYDEHEILSLKRGRSPIYNWVECWAIVFVSRSLSLSLPRSLAFLYSISIPLSFSLSLAPSHGKRRSRSRLLSEIKIPRYARANVALSEITHLTRGLLNPTRFFQVPREQSAESGKRARARTPSNKSERLAYTSNL